MIKKFHEDLRNPKRNVHVFELMALKKRKSSGSYRKLTLYVVDDMIYVKTVKFQINPFSKIFLNFHNF